MVCDAKLFRYAMPKGLSWTNSFMFDDEFEEHSKLDILPAFTCPLDVYHRYVPERFVSPRMCAFLAEFCSDARDGSSAGSRDRPPGGGLRCDPTSSLRGAEVVRMNEKLTGSRWGLTQTLEGTGRRAQTSPAALAIRPGQWRGPEASPSRPTAPPNATQAWPA
jgi:hypothetical protein